MILEVERKKIIETCLEMIEKKLTNGTSGNVSIYSRKENLVAITPTGVAYKTMKPEDVSIVDLEGNLIEGKKPTSELEMHLLNYRNREDVSAIIHAHTVHATSVACLRKELPAVDYMVAVCGAKSVPCAKYATYGTQELAINAYESMKGIKATLLANHGINTAADTIENAFHILEQIEYVAQLYILSSQLGAPVILEDSEMENMLERFKSYGQAGK